MSVIAIDPGPEESAFITWDGDKVCQYGINPNSYLLASLYATQQEDRYPQDDNDIYAIEMVACYGMPVGKEVFETCVWIGRFCEACRAFPRLIYRRDIKLHHCGSPRAKDSNIRQALIDKYGEPGTKKNPGKLYGVKSHLWAALAIATYVTETAKEKGLTSQAASLNIAA